MLTKIYKNSNSEIFKKIVLKGFIKIARKEPWRISFIHKPTRRTWSGSREVV